MIPVNQRFPTFLDPRDFGASNDGRKDCTEGITKAMQAAIDPSNPGTVWLARGEWLTGPLHFPGPGVYLQGEGYGCFPQDGPLTRLVARDDPGESGPLLALDASLAGVDWLRNVGYNNICFDISRSRRFVPPSIPSAIPPPAVSHLGVSNCGAAFRRSIVYGGIGNGWYHGTNPQVPTAWGENYSMVECGHMAGYLPDGTLGPTPPIAPSVIVSGVDCLIIDGGTYGYGYNALPIPLRGGLADVPAFLWRSELRPDGQPNTGIGSMMTGRVKITNYAVSVRVAVLDCPAQGTIFGPTGWVFDNVLVEGFHDAFQIGQESVSLPGSWARPRGIIRGCELGGANGWYPYIDGRLQGMSARVNHTNGGRLELASLAQDGDVGLGTDCNGLRVQIGRNPNGKMGYKVNDLGKDNDISYVG